MTRISSTVALATIVPAFFLSLTAHADPRTSYLVEQLKSDNQGIRAQALMALGASADDAAVQPLCDALRDKQAPIRTAAVKGLGSLAKPAALTCLQAAEPKEKDAGVKAEIKKSITSLKTASTPAGLQKPPPPDATSKFYVAIEVTNKTTRSSNDVEAVIRSAMQTKLLGQKGCAIAPKGEVSATGRQIIKARKLKGFLLSAVVEPSIQEGSDLKQIVRLTVWSYPDKILKGEFAVKLSQSNTKKGDTPSEDSLMKMSVESSIDSFWKVADTL